MKEKLKQHANKLYLILAFVSGGGLGQITDFVGDVKELIKSDSKKPKPTSINGGSIQDEIRYVEKDFNFIKQTAKQSR